MLFLSESQAIQRLISTIHHLKEALGIRVPPSYRGPEDPVARSLNIQVKHAPLPGSDEGWYRDGDPPEITLDVAKVTDPDRLNFTYFHEITHHLIRQDDELYSFLDQFAPDSRDFEQVREHYCNVGAAEFLIPGQEVRQAIEKHGFTINLVPTLASRYPASKPAIAIQLAHCATHQCFVTICEFGLPPNKGPAQPSLSKDFGVQGAHLYVLYAANSSSVAKYRIGRYTPISRNHLITATYQSGQGQKGEDRIPFRSGTIWKCDCETLFYRGKVYAIFNASPPTAPNQHQLSLFPAL